MNMGMTQSRQTKSEVNHVQQNVVSTEVQLLKEEERRELNATTVEKRATWQKTENVRHG